MSSSNTFRATIADRQVDITFNADDVLIDGKSVHVDFRLIAERKLHVLLEGRSYEVFFEDTDPESFSLLVEDRRRRVAVQSRRDLLLERYGLTTGSHTGQTQVRAPMPGLVLQVLVAEGQDVEIGAPLLVLEAMKMENEVRAASAGSIARVHVGAGDAVGKNELLIEFGA